MKTKRISKIISIIFLVSIILSFCFVIKNIDHDCDHTDTCPVCEVIHQIRDNLHYTPTIYKELFFLLGIFVAITKVICIIFCNKKESTLVGLKVQLNN